MSLRDRLRGLLREPLFHFLIGGLLIFVYFAWRGVAADPASRTITIDELQVERLAAQFSQTYQRPPTADEIDGLIRDFIEEEVYYREALRLGLDVDDPVIRRRLRTKMKFLASSAVEAVQPSDAELQKLLDANPARYAADTAYSFDQVYIAVRDREVDEKRATTVLDRLRKGERWQGAGDPLSVPSSMSAAGQTEVGREFGSEFVENLTALAKQPLNVWRGPVASGFGLHLVRLRVVDVPSKPRLADVRQEVENDWRSRTVEERQAQAYQALLDEYSIRIAKP